MPKTLSEPAAVLQRIKLHGPTMATRWSVLCDVDPQLDQNALRNALAAAVERVDQQMSPWKPDSDLMRLNRATPGEWVSLPPEIMAVLARALEIARLSDGAFDPGVGVCGKAGQGVPVGIGQPSLKMGGLTVGGTAV